MASKLFDLHGRKALITGASRGLGRAMAEGLMEAGAEAVLVGTSQTALEVADAYQAQGFKCQGLAADLGDFEQLTACFNKVLDIFNGKLDILLTAHGIQRRHLPEDFPLAEWDEIIRVNLTSVFLLCQEAGKVMLKAGHGKIINVASMLSFFGGQTVPAYAASKGGIAQLTKALSNDWLARGINVNCIAPGYMATDMNVALTDPSNPRCQQIVERIPAGRWGKPDDMKGVAVFLASHASDYVGGAVIPVDGGYLVK